MNKFFLFFSWIGNWTLNLFDANHYQIIDGERYRTEDQFYVGVSKKEQNTDSFPENNESTTQNLDDLESQNQDLNNVALDWKTLDNNQQISINNQDIWIDLSGHEINNPENQL